MNGGGLKMDMKEFLSMMVDNILETDQEISEETQLANIAEWDSLAMVSFSAMAQANGKLVSRDAIKSANTIRNLYDLVN